jgi:hypothetical protein
MKTYLVEVVGNDTFDRCHLVKADNIEQAVESLPNILECFGCTTIEQFIRVTVRLESES